MENQKKYLKAICFVYEKRKQGAVITSHNESKKRLIKASKRGDISSLLVELTKGVDVNGKDLDGMTALIWAARRGYIDIIRILLSKGADPDGKDVYGWTAMDWAKSRGYHKAVKLLKNAGTKK